ncbi:unnamed protein product [Cylicostephanus goldi]|uniref:Mitochondrial outer membrane transport complex Sam37/metaxin N-terminal domain-containing protein n=1 Tax=Cylicostephanus goldi TaxID=71465 RepID=A0A3P6R8V7_CYLGO|nr:unnamed protein product [Cylicostephanus goldi]
MELHVWPADFGLPSIDVSCLQFLACAKMCASPVSVVYSSSPWNSPTGKYSIVQYSSQDIRVVSAFLLRFVEVLRKSGQEVVIDAELTASEKSQIDAFSCYLQQYLNPAVLHTFWLDDLNYSTVTHHWYSSRLSFPYNMYYLEKHRKRIQRFLSDKTVTVIMKDGLEVTFARLVFPAQFSSHSIWIYEMIHILD